MGEKKSQPVFDLIGIGLGCGVHLSVAVFTLDLLRYSGGSGEPEQCPIRCHHEYFFGVTAMIFYAPGGYLADKLS